MTLIKIFYSFLFSGQIQVGFWAQIIQSRECNLCKQYYFFIQQALHNVIYLICIKQTMLNNITFWHRDIKQIVSLQKQLRTLIKIDNINKLFHNLWPDLTAFTDKEDHKKKKKIWALRTSRFFKSFLFFFYDIGHCNFFQLKNGGLCGYTCVSLYTVKPVLMVTSEQRPPVNNGWFNLATATISLTSIRASLSNGHFFHVLRVAVVHRFDCTYSKICTILNTI
jgi:hypothetical protein